MSIMNTIREPRPTATRVQESTKPEINQRILRSAEENVARASSGSDAIDARLRELEREWDIERVLQTNFGIINLVTISLGALVARPFFALTGIAAGFMFEHALKGWCPPVPVFRRLGYRTASEIDQERFALKALRGDFKGVDPSHGREAFEAAAIPNPELRSPV